MVSVCAAVALSTSIIPVIPVSADTGMTRYEAERQYTGGWADVVQNSIASGGYVVERIGGKSTDIGTVVFKIWAEEAGTYNAKLGYISKRIRFLCQSKLVCMGYRKRHKIHDNGKQ